jgi:hypothetical protein
MWRKLRLAATVLALMLILMLTLSLAAQAKNPQVSSWVKNLSEGTLVEETGDSDLEPEIKVVGSTVHVVWATGRPSYDKSYVYYKRSLDGGKTFKPKKIIFEGRLTTVDTSWPSKRLAVSGTNVHVLVSGAMGAYYLRSVDNGVSFETIGVSHSYVTGSMVEAVGQQVTLAWVANYNNVACQNSINNGQDFVPPRVVYSGTDVGLIDLNISENKIFLFFNDPFYDWNKNRWLSKLHLASSPDGGETFGTQVLHTLPQSTVQSGNYTPKIAAVGSNVYVTWTGFNSLDQSRLFFRRSIDNGATWGPLVGYTGPTGLTLLEASIAAQDNRVYLVFRGEDSKNTSISRVFFKRSLDSGATFQASKALTALGAPYGGRGEKPLVQIDPSDPTGAKLNVLWNTPTFVSSKDYGTSFTGPVLLGPSYWTNCSHLRLAVGDNGEVHWVADGYFDFHSDSDIFYRRWERQPAIPSTTDKALLLTTDVTQGRYDTMQVAASHDTNFTSAFTVETWIKPKHITGEESYILLKYDNIARDLSPYTLLQWGAGQLVGIIQTTDNTFFVNGKTLPNGVWSHVAMTYNAKKMGNNLCLFVDGALVGQEAATGNLKPGNGILFLGGPQPYRYYASLALDELRLWKYARTGQQIKDNYNKILLGTEGGLAAYYQFNNSTYDKTGHGNDGVLMYKESFVNR